MSVDAFRTPIASETEFNWLVFDGPDGVFRLKSERDNQFLQINGNDVVLARDAANPPAQSDPTQNLTFQQFRLRPVGQGNVIVSVANSNLALAFDTQNQVVVSTFRDRFDTGIRSKTFVLNVVPF